MQKNLIEMVFILDRSGSMQGLEDDTIGGFNSMIEKHKKLAGDAIISTVLFNHKFKVIHDRLKIENVQPLNNNDYYVSGTTALLDAIGRSINKITNTYKYIPKESKAEKVIFVITTDGMENSSNEFDYQTIKAMINRQKELHDWEFVFLGANIDAIDVASKFGINIDRAVNYHADKEGIKLNYEIIGDALTELRVNKKMSEDWFEKIEKDYNKRK